LIAVASSKFDPEPELTAFSTADRYIKFIRLYNNLAHRNVVAATPNDEVAVWRFNFNVPRTRREMPTRIRVLPRNRAQGMWLFLGVPQGQEEALLAGTRGFPLQPVDLDAVPDAIRWWSARKRETVMEQLARPAGDRRRFNLRSLTWFIGEADEITLNRVATRPGLEVPLMLGVYAPGLSRQSPFEIDVVQELWHQRVGQLNLRIAR
jgi:hypothetical protein